ncbi:MAG: PAS domain S-box protein [Deltaproteobacteria bacterium]|nr:PAS domain S-box protein [Deltaproteobacteria bacterium]
MSKVKILLVEDELIEAEDLNLTLDDLGFEVISIASTAEQAIKKADEAPPDLAIVDIGLKGKKSGLEAALLIRSNLNIPVIYITAHTDDENLEEAVLTEPDGFLLKPVDERQLKITIQIALCKHGYKKELENALSLTRKRYRQLVDHMSEGIAVIDEEGTITFINDRFLEIHGYAKEEVIGRSATDFLEDDSIKKFKKELESRAKGHRNTYELAWKKKDGRSIITLVSPEPIYDEKGRYKGSIAVLTDITERRQIEKELVESRSRLRKFSQHLQSIREEERTVIAREIHDELGQALTALKIDLSWISSKLDDVPQDKGKILERTKSMDNLIDETVRKIQKISSDLRPGILDDLGLVPAIEWQVEEFKRRTNIACECRADEDAINIEINPECSTALFRVTQEALTNIARHAEATRARISLRRNGSKLELKISDNGKGITEESVLSPESLGLMGMRERIRPFGGELKIESVPKKGTTLSIALPLDESEGIK